MAKLASKHFKVYKNESGPVVSTVTRKIIKKDGLFFKDIDGSGELSIVNDWRNSPEVRAKEYVKKLTVDEKIAQLFISDWRMGPKYKNERLPGHVATPGESGVLDDAEVHQKTIFGEQHLPGTTVLLKEWFSRHTILRDNASVEDLTDYLNQLQTVAEECERFVPVLVASNSRNENGEVVFGMNDAGGVFPTWPGTMGIAAGVLGSGIEVADNWADAIRRSWNAVGLRKGYMYMADVMSDPRWQRTYGTFGEDPKLICEIMEHIIPRVQGSEQGVTSNGVALTTKHFPGGGARENGFDPHYAAGQWNVYATPNSLQKYHMPGFKVAVAKNTQAIMPYYSKPSKEKSSIQKDMLGNDIKFDPYGFAYNKTFIDEILRKQMGFKGYINSDTGIVHNMKWGVEMLDEAERIAFAIRHSGVDLISGLFDNEYGKTAYNRSTNSYYETHKLPDGFTKEMVTLNDEALDKAVTRTLKAMFELGMFEDTYRDPLKAKEIVANKNDWNNAYEGHLKSVTLLKNDGTLPLSKEKLNGKLVYAEAFCKNPKQAEIATNELRKTLTNVELTLDYTKADYAILFVSPSSGDYFTATAGYLELDICEDKVVPNVDDNCRPLSETHLETTLTNVNKIKDIYEAISKNNGKVISNINFTLAWLVGNVEKYSDVLLAGFDTYPSATLDVIFGKYHPTGKLPITLPKNDDVIKVNEMGICISPNDVPGFDKDLYMPSYLKDENNKAYAYKDAHGNYYELNFGLTY